MKVKASGMAEMIIAVCIISIAIGLFSLLFIRSTSSNLNYLEIKNQTEIQNQVYQSLLINNDDSLFIFNKSGIKTDLKKLNNKLSQLIWINSGGKVLWSQEFFELKIEK